jgi:hypothetical protein
MKSIHMHLVALVARLHQHPGGAFSVAGGGTEVGLAADAAFRIELASASEPMKGVSKMKH